MKKAIQFGAGNIGRGFIGGLLSKAGYHVVFADVNQKIIDKINEDKKYTIFVKDVESSEIVITDISGVNSTKPELIDEVKEAEIITTAVGVRILPIIAPSIAEGIKARKENGSIFDVLIGYYSEKEKYTRMKQKSSDLRKIVQTALERTSKKYDLQLRQLKDTEKREKFKVYGELTQTYGYGLEPNAKSFLQNIIS